MEKKIKLFYQIIFKNFLEKQKPIFFFQMLIAENKDTFTKYHYESTRMQLFLNFANENEMTTVTQS